MELQFSSHYIEIVIPLFLYLEHTPVTSGFILSIHLPLQHSWYYVMLSITIFCYARVLLCWLSFRWVSFCSMSWHHSIVTAYLLSVKNAFFPELKPDLPFCTYFDLLLSTWHHDIQQNDVKVTMTLSITTLSITTFSIMILIVTLNIKDNEHNDTRRKH